VLPLELFRNRVFSLACAIGFVVGFALFGATTFLPLFLQVVNGASPTSSGLRLLPMILGVLTTSITSGLLITSWGRYKPFPIAGTALMVLGLFLLSQMNEQTSILVASLDMLVLGMGLGVPGEKLSPAIESLTQNELVTETSALDGQAGGQLLLTPAGQQALDKLAAAYHDSLAELLDGWSPEQESELATLLRRVATRLLSEDTSKDLVTTRLG
jgi:DNA-binding MarR family transcriptional regulator